jgi:hypothetical protein
MELDWYCNDMLEMRHQCWWGLLWIFKRLLVSLLRRQRSPRLNVWFLIVNIWVNRVGIVSSVITKIFNPSKYCTVTTQPLLNDTLLISACIVYCQFSLFDICSTFVRFSVFVWFSAFVRFSIFVQLSAFVRFGSFVLYSNYSVYFLSWYWKCISGILIPFYNNQQAINKHHTADSTIFCFSTESKGPITIIDQEGYPEPIYPYGLSRRRDNQSTLPLPSHGESAVPAGRHHLLCVSTGLRLHLHLRLTWLLLSSHLAGISQIYCIAGNRTWLYRLPQSQKQCI